MTDAKKLLSNTLKEIANIEEETLQKFLSLFKLRQFEKKHHYAEAGEYSRNMGFVIAGILRAYHRTKSGDIYNKTFFTKGSFTGAYSSLVTGNRNLIDIECLTHVTLLECKYADFTALFDDHQSLECIARIIAEHYFVSKENREIQLVTLNASERYQLFLKNHSEIEQHIPQYHIASYLGITPTQLSRIRAKK